ncbi:MAG: hypothetical protein AB1815_13495 [Bacillota bacterium]
MVTGGTANAGGLIRTDEPIPPEIVEKVRLTRFYPNRLAGMSQDEIEVALAELKNMDDSPMDDQEQ